MSAVQELPLSDLRADDVGLRVIIARDGNTFDGLLAQMDVLRSDYEFKDKPRITARLVMKTVVEVPGSSDRVTSELKMTGLPLDYLIQIDRTATDG